MSTSADFLFPSFRQPVSNRVDGFTQRCQKARAILFSPEMVLALQAGTKTQTRRVADPVGMRIHLHEAVRSELPVVLQEPGMFAKAGDHDVSQINKHGALCVRAVNGQHLGVKPAEFEWLSPYGRPGDELWVREAWQGEKQWDRFAPRDLVPGSCIWYVADGASNRPDVASERTPGRVRSNIHLPRWGCRTLLRITSVRVERLHDITEADAQAEGITAEQAAAAGGYALAFRALWERIHNTFWESHNPWVYVLNFEVDHK